jgi:protein SCO1
MLRALVLAALLGVASPALATGNLPIKVGGAFELVDQNGRPRTQIDPDGRAQLLFFGYINCPGICPTALPTMADAVDILAQQGLAVRPVMITVDPSRDTVENMGLPMARLHPDFVGLTGSEDALAQAYKAFSVEKRLELIDPEIGAIYSHATFVYLLDAQGKVLTLLPPILTGERVASIVQGYISPKE